MLPAFYASVFFGKILSIQLLTLINLCIDSLQETVWKSTAYSCHFWDSFLVGIRVKDPRQLSGV
jgi:hypothetical protein